MRSYKSGVRCSVSIGSAPRQTNTMTDNLDDNQQSAAASYADEVLCANWHPLVLLLAEPLARVKKTALTDRDAADFLARLYLCQQA